MVIRNKCYNTCFYLHNRFRIRKLFLVRHDTIRRLVMGGAYLECMKSSFCPTFFVLEICLFGSIAINIVVKVFHIWHSDPYMDRLRPSRVYVWCHGGQETIFEYFMHSNFQMDINLPWIDAAFTSSFT
jgi:hypothetical protein